MARRQTNRVVAEAPPSNDYALEDGSGNNVGYAATFEEALGKMRKSLKAIVCRRVSDGAELAVHQPSGLFRRKAGTEATPS